MNVYSIEYSDGDVTDWYVAADESDAVKRHREQMDAMGYGPDDDEAKVTRISAEPDEKLLTMNCDTEQETRPAAAWAASMPEGGLLGSTEY